MTLGSNTPPTQADWLASFVYQPVGTMGITTDQLPSDSIWIPVAYNIAIDIVNIDIQTISTDLYQLAVYNLAASNLINYTPDVPGAPPYKYGDGVMSFFAYLRKQWDIYGLSTGVIQSSADVSTSESFVVLEAAKNFTLSDLQNLKDPYGRVYLSIAQQTGTQWGIS